MWYKLSDLFDLQMGKTPSRNNPNYWNSNDYLWVSISDMSGYDKYVSSTKEYISELAVKESGIKTIPANTVIMSFKLSIGKTAITTDSIFSNEAIMAFIDKKTTAIDPEYIFYLFSGKDWDEGSNKAVMGKTLNKVTLSNIEVDIPSLDIQKERVDKLNKISTLIADKKQQLNQLDELVKARFVEMFKEKYDLFKVDKKLKTTSGGTPKSSVSEYYDGGDIPWLTSGEVNYGDITKPSNYITEKGLNNSSAKWVPEDSIVIAMYGATAGKVGIVRYKTTTNQAVCSVLPNDNFNQEFLRYAFQDISEELTSKAIGGGQSNISQTIIKNSYIVDAPIEEQERFASFAKQVDKSKFALQNSIKSLMNLWYNINNMFCERTYGEA